MKLIRTLALLLILVFLAACQQESNDNPAGSDRATRTPAGDTRTRATLAPSAEPPETGTTTRPTAPASPTERATTAPTGTPASSFDGNGEEGALIAVSMESRVGVLLDEFPEVLRERVAEAILDEGDEYWEERARRQIRLTKLNLNFRNFDHPDKGQLPLPPAPLWNVTLDPAGPSRQEIDGHDVIAIGYTFESTLLTDPASVAESEPALAEEGGTWEEPFVFPVDPDLLLQRTDNACINEAGFPANSYDSENYWHFYDDTCQADDGGLVGCHRTRLPQFSCQEALAFFVGQVPTAVRFERLPWDDDLADEVRLGDITVLEDPDLLVVEEELANHRLIYRYIQADNCALVEDAVAAGGWRRLLQFDATVHNVGGEVLHIGQVREDPVHNVFQYSPCHNHFHYNYYGEFFLQDIANILGQKQAFCVQSTNRYSNHELAPLVHNYTCRFQGIQVGWVDEYVAGLDTQWIDVTDLDVPEDGLTVELGFTSNADRFLCEGDLVLDENGEQVWEPTEFTTPLGTTVDRPACEFIEDWDVNNQGLQEVFVPQFGSFVTLPCRGGEIGPLRNCGFTAVPLEDEADEEENACAVGQDVNLNFRVAEGDAPLVLRACEYSAALGTGVACTHEDSLANVIIGGSRTEVTFSCPMVRDATEFSGRYSLYTAPLWPEDDLQELQ